MNEIRLCLGSLSLSSVQILSPSKIQKLYKSFIFLHFSLEENYNNTKQASYGSHISFNKISPSIPWSSGFFSI